MRLVNCFWIALIVLGSALICHAQSINVTASPTISDNPPPWAMLNQQVTGTFTLDPTNLSADIQQELANQGAVQEYTIAAGTGGGPTPEGTFTSVTLEGQTLTSDGWAGDFYVTFDNTDSKIFISVPSGGSVGLLPGVQTTGSWATTGTKFMIITGTATTDGGSVNLTVGPQAAGWYLVNCRIDGTNAVSGTQVPDAQKSSPGCFVSAAGVNPAASLKVEAINNVNTSLVRQVAWSSLTKMFVNGAAPVNASLDAGPDTTYSPVTLSAAFNSGDTVTVTETLVAPSGSIGVTDSITLRQMFSVDIKDSTGTVITGQTITIPVGLNVSISSAITPAGLPGATYSWDVGTTTVKTYQQALGSTTLTNLAAHGDLDQSGLSYYYIDGGNKAVKLSVTSEGTTATAQVTYTITRPTATFTGTTTSNNPPVDAGSDGFHNNVLHFGSNNVGQYGITWNGSVTTPAGGAGQIMICQRGKPDRHFVANDAPGTRTKFTSGGVFVNDNPTPYGGTVVNLADSDVQPITQNDTPDNFLTGLIKNTCSDSFETYLMYKPSGNGIWVTLRELDWNWSGTATWNANPAPGAWTVANGTPAAASQNIASNDSTTLPVWSDYWTDLSIVPE